MDFSPVVRDPRKRRRETSNEGEDSKRLKREECPESPDVRLLSK